MDERNEEKYARALDAMQQYEGDIPVKFRIEGQSYAMETHVRKCQGIIYELSDILGEKNVMFFEK